MSISGPKPEYPNLGAYKAAFITCGFYGCIEEWIAWGMQESAEDMAARLSGYVWNMPLPSAAGVHNWKGNYLIERTCSRTDWRISPLHSGEKCGILNKLLCVPLGTELPEVLQGAPNQNMQRCRIGHNGADSKSCYLR